MASPPPLLRKLRRVLHPVPGRLTQCRRTALGLLQRLINDPPFHSIHHHPRVSIRPQLLISPESRFDKFTDRDAKAFLHRRPLHWGVLGTKITHSGIYCASLDPPRPCFITNCDD